MKELEGSLDLLLGRCRGNNSEGVDVVDFVTVEKAVIGCRLARKRSSSKEAFMVRKSRGSGSKLMWLQGCWREGSYCVPPWFTFLFCYFVFVLGKGGVVLVRWWVC
jgi:hypothetical protein